MKDAHGRYMCRACHDARAGGGDGEGGGGRPDTGRLARPGTDGLMETRARGREADGADGGIIPLEPEGGARAETIPLAEEFPEARPCPSCKAEMAPGAVVCVSCGFDARSRLKHATTRIAEDEPDPDAPKPKRKFTDPDLCGYCGYKLAGLPSGKCPECGQLNSLSRRDDRLVEDSRRIAREAYQRPAVMFAIGFAGIAGTLLYRGNAMGIVAELVKWVVEVPVGVGVYWVCCLTFLGFDAPMRLVALRLAGIYALVDFVYVLLSFQPVWIWPTGLSGLLYIYLLMEELEMDRGDAVIVGMLTFVAKVGVYVGISMLL